ncbi:MAG: phosphoribosyltransferase family protein [Burkholderiales bacterium]
MARIDRDGAYRFVARDQSVRHAAVPACEPDARTRVQVTHVPLKPFLSDEAMRDNIRPAVFVDRADAGHRLAQRLMAMRWRAPVVVLALPRGGVPVATEVASALGAALDLLLVRKIGAPWNPELALAALVDGDPPEIVLNDELSDLAGADRSHIEAEALRARSELERRRSVYLHGRAPLGVQGATVIVVDDGIATGTTMRAALRALRRRRPGRLVLAVPVAPAAVLEALRAEADDVVCLRAPDDFDAVGEHYLDFRQVDDGDVTAALAKAGSGSKERNDA